jgi:hypothetical protein
MQLKVITTDQVYRFNQQGQLIDAITEPYVRVDTATKEDLIGLYDSLVEHIALAFTYAGSQITGLAANYVDSIQDFLLVKDAWWLKDLEDPSSDLEIKSPEATGCNCGKSEGCCGLGNGDCSGGKCAEETVAVPPLDIPEEAPPLTGFIANEAQRSLLKDLQEAAARLRLIKPVAGDVFKVQMQKQVQAVYYFGTEDPAQAYSQAEANVSRLKQDAMTMGVPANVVEMNMTEVAVPDLDEGDDENENED